MRRAFYWVMIASIPVLPIWLLFGRALFGAPLGTALVAQALLAPLLALALVAVVGLTIARKEVRGPRSATWHDVRSVGPWLLAIVVVALLVVDTAGNRKGSALTALVGEGATTASASIAALLTVVIAISTLVLVVVQARLLVLETKTRVTSYLEGVGARAQSPILGEAYFERVDDSSAPQAGEMITIEAEDSDQR